jgi:hypothetical protein
MSNGTIAELTMRECHRVAGDLGAATGMTISVGEALVERIQQGSSIAILGARPVVEAVGQVLPALVGQVLLSEEASGAVSLFLDVQEGEVHATINTHEHQVRIALAWPMDRGRVNVGADQLMTQAVHEAGHLLCGVVLGRRTPLQACARTSSERIGGFVAWATKEGVPKRRDLVPHLAQKLGGWVAERLVFGDDQVSAGSGNDLEQATEFALDMIKSQGFGTSWFKYAEHPTANGPGFRSGLAEAEREARELLRQAEALAEQTLSERRSTLLHIAENMAAKGSLGRDELQDLLGADGPQVVRLRYRDEKDPGTSGTVAAAS